MASVVTVVIFLINEQFKPPYMPNFVCLLHFFACTNISS
jgi:hypothetical protein